MSLTQQDITKAIERRDAHQVGGIGVFLCLFFLFVGFGVGKWDFVKSTWWIGAPALAISCRIAGSKD